MKLARYMEALKLNGEQMAQKLRDAGAKCTRSAVSRMRMGKQWLSREMAAAMPRATDGMVTAADFVDGPAVTLAPPATSPPKKKRSNSPVSSGHLAGR